MMNFKTLSGFLLAWMLFSCEGKVTKIENERQGQLKPIMKLSNVAEKKFPLDSFSAPKPQYSQIYTDSNGRRIFTFLNTYNNSIYFYDFATMKFLRKNSFQDDRTQANAIVNGYYIKSEDSVYLFNRKNNELVLTGPGKSTLQRISLINNRNPKDLSWIYSYPQYYPQTVAPILAMGNQLIFPGQFMFSIPDTLIDKFQFESHISLDGGKVSYKKKYPHSLYGDNINWENEGLYTSVYYDILADSNEMIYSFPVSHDVYSSELTGDNYQVKYGGSNDAGDIVSFGQDKLPTEELILKVCKTDLYAAIKYDEYRKVFYRFLRKSIPDADKTTSLRDKPIVVIVFDKSFKYLGETTIGDGHNFNWENTFVTEEGLHVEYIASEDTKSEEYLSYKVFLPRNIN